MVEAGTYTIRMELADANSTTATQNHEATFTVTKGATAQMQTGLSNNGFVNVDVNFQPSAASATCGNGVVDSGETCDGAACPTACAVSDDPCMNNVLVGGATTCDARCTLQSNGTCDGAEGGDITGGCAATPGAGWLVVLAMALAWRRRGTCA